MGLKEALFREKIDTSIPGVEFLQSMLSDIDLEAEIDIPQRAEIHRAILRVLPKAQRTTAELARKDAGMRRAAQRRHEASLPSQRQLDYIRSLGGNPEPVITRASASKMIDDLLEGSEENLSDAASQRQIDYIVDSLKTQPVKKGCLLVMLILLALPVGAVFSAWVAART